MYLTQAYLEDVYGADQVASLCTSAASLAATIELAEAEVESALRVGGYTTLVPPSVFVAIDAVPRAVKLAAYRCWLILAHDRQGIPVEQETLEGWRQPVRDLREGLIEIDAPVDTARAPGGVSFTSTASSSSAPGREPVFAAEKMGDF